MGLFFILAIFFIGGGWLIGKIVGNILFPKENDVENYAGNTFVDNSTHHHFHVHTEKKSTEIKSLGKYADNLHEETIDINHN